MTQNDEWWCSLHVTEKERIAKKIKGIDAPYPECTTVWLNLDEKQKTWIKNHCTHGHGVIIPDWQEGQMYSE